MHGNIKGGEIEYDPQRKDKKKINKFSVPIPDILLFSSYI